MNKYFHIHKIRLFFLLLVLIGGVYIFRRYYSSNQILLRPSIDSVEVNNSPLDNQSKNSLIDNDKETWVAIAPNSQNTLTLSVTFPLTKINQIGFDIGKEYLNHHEIVLYKGEGVVYQQSHNEANYRVDKFLLPQSFETDRIELIFQKIDKSIDMSEIFFWQSSKTTSRGILFIPRSCTGYLTTIAVIWGLVFLCGCLVIKILKVKEFGLGLVYSIGISLIFVISLLRLLLHNDLIFLLIPLLSLFSLVVYWKHILLTFIKNKFLLLVQLVAILLLCLLTMFFDFSPNISRYDSYYDFNQTYAFPIGYYKQDYLMPFGAAKIFLYNLDQKFSYPHLLGSYSISDRTPLVPLFTTPFLSFFGDRLFVYQAVMILLVSLIVTIGFSFQNKILTPNISKVIPILFICQFFLYLYHFVPVRLIALYFLLHYFNELFFKKNPNWKLLIFYSLLSFLTHPISLPYIFLPALFLIIARKDYKKSLFLFIPLLTFILWVIWGISLGKPNPFLLSPINLTTPSIGQPVASFDLRNHLSNRFFNFLGLFINSPHPQISGVGLGFYRFTVIGAATISGITFFVLSCIKNIKSKNKTFFIQLFIYLIILPIFFIVFISQGSYSRRGLAENLFPVIYIVLLLGFNYISSLTPIILIGSIFLYCLENIWLLINLDLEPLLSYFVENNTLPSYNWLLSSIILCYILFISLTIMYAQKKQIK